MKKVLSIITLALFLVAFSAPAFCDNPPKEKAKCEADSLKSKKCCHAKDSVKCAEAKKKGECTKADKAKCCKDKSVK